MRKITKGDKIVTCAFVTIISFFFCFIALRFVTRQVFVEHFRMSNSVIDLILFDADVLKVTNTSIIGIDWQELYPFDAEMQEVNLDVNKKSLLEKYEEKVVDIEDRIEPYTTTYLPWHIKLTELAYWFDDCIQWNIVTYSEYNGITKVDGQYFAELSAQKDVSEIAESTISFAKYCEKRGINFLYVGQPSKICIYEDENISGSTDYSNQNMDDFLDVLQDSEVDTYDHRTDIHAENLNHHDLFYRTDHHWKAETGLWAAQHILDYLNNQYGYHFDSSILDADNFTYDIYQDWFLGSQGKKVTLGVADPEDIALIYPKFETSLHFQIPGIGLDEYGSFEITYDMAHIDEIDYYNKNPYSAYNYENQALIQIENKMIADGPKVLIIHHSFANCEIPFLSMGIKYIDAIDLRQFTGSVRSYIEQTNPDIVIVTYNSINGSIDLTSHEDLYDFR